MRRADTLAPRQPGVLHTLGLVALAAGDVAVAIDALQRLATHRGDMPRATLASALAMLANVLCDLAGC